MVAEISRLELNRLNLFHIHLENCMSLEKPRYKLPIITMQRAANRFFQTFNQNMIIKWFAQETNRTSFDRLLSLAVIRKGG